MRISGKVLAATMTFVAVATIVGAILGDSAPADLVAPALRLDCDTPVDADAARHCQRLRALALEDF